MSATAPQDDVGVVEKSLKAIAIEDAPPVDPIETKPSATPSPPPAPVHPTVSTGQLPLSILVSWHPPRPQEVQTFIDFVDSLGAHPARPFVLFQHSSGFQAKYKLSKSDSHLSFAIELAYLAIDALPQHDPRLPVFLHNYARALQCLWEKVSTPQSLDKMVEYYKKALDASREADPARTLYLSDVGFVLIRRYEQCKTPQDLLDARKYLEMSIDSGTLNALSQAQCRNNISLLLQMEYESTKRIAALDEAIEIQENIIQSLPQPGPTAQNRMFFRNLGTIYTNRFKATHVLTDIQKAIGNISKALQPPEANPNRTLMLSELGTAFSLEFERTGSLTGLDRAIDCFAEAAADDQPQNQHTRLLHLRDALLSRYERIRTEDDLEKSIELSKRALEIATDLSIAKKSNIINCLAKALKTRSERASSTSDLNDSIQHYQSIITESPSDQDEPLYIHNYANALQYRSFLTGSMDDLHTAIKLYERAYRLTPADHLDRPMYLAGLGNSLHLRYQRTNSLADLNAAIVHLRRTLDATLNEDPRFQGRSYNLGWALLNKFNEMKDVTDLNAAIRTLESALNRTSDDNRRALAFFSNILGAAYYRAFEQSGELDDLNKSIQFYEQAQKSAEGFVLTSLILSNLGVSLGAKADLTQDGKDIVASIRMRTDAVQNTPANDVVLADRLFMLGAAFEKWLNKYPGGADAAIGCYEKALGIVLAKPLTRISVALRAASLHEKVDSNLNKACTLMIQAVELLPEAISLSLLSSDQLRLLPMFSSLSEDATSLALADGRPPDEALRIFELSRGIMLNRFLSNRNTGSNLGEKHPDLAKRFFAARDILYPTVDFQQRQVEAMSSDQFGVRRNIAAAEYAQTLVEIRSLDEFKDFNQPSNSTHLHDHGVRWPVVAINLHQRRSDALIVTSTGVTIFPLFKLEFEDATRNMAAVVHAINSIDTNISEAHRFFEDAMKWLWDCAAEPILEHLGFRGSPKPGEPWPRIWWISSGLFSLLPIHAAGDYAKQKNTGEPCTVLDRAISSYSPTLTTLIYAFNRMRTLETDVNPEQSRALIVGMPNTPGKSPLQNAPKEVESVKRLLEKSMPVDVRMHPKQAEVVSLLKGATIAHFACHGISDKQDPSKSRLLLTDHMERPFDFRVLSKIRLKQCRLVYLSACSTAENKNFKLSSESIHLVGGFQLADVPTVIGTLWEIDDKEALRVTALFYESLLEGGQAHTTRSAEALHHSIRRYRDQCTSDHAVFNWAAYIHYGI